MRPDLRKHLRAGFLLGLIPALVAGPLTGWWVAGSITSAFAGLIKEYVYDASGRGTVDHDDFAHTWAGGFLADGVAFLLWFLIGSVL